MGTIQLVAVLTGALSLSAPEQRVDELFRPVAGDKMPGAVVAVVRDGKPLFLKSYGMADVAKGVPNSPGAIFRIASVTKCFTSIAVLQLVEAGKLKLDDPVAKYLPDAPSADRMRISHLLGHTAGVPDFLSLEEIKRARLEFDPGSRISYSNSGYQLLGQLIEKVSGQPWDEYLRDRMFTPLGMRHTGYDSTAELAGRATGYLVGKDGRYAPIAAQDAKGAYAAGGLYSTVEDLVRWEQGLAAGKLVRNQTLELAFTPGTLTDGRKTRYGLGWMTNTYRGLREVGHGGDITGFNSYIARYPDEKLTVIVLSNTGMRPPGPLASAGDLAHRIAEIWLGDRMEKTAPRREIRIAPEVLQSYAGRYRLEAPETALRAMGTHLVITVEGGRLIAESNGMKLPLDALSEITFQAAGSPAELTFARGSAAKCPKIVITVMGLREFEAVRADE